MTETGPLSSSVLIAAVSSFFSAPSDVSSLFAAGAAETGVTATAVLLEGVATPLVEGVLEVEAALTNT